MRSRSFFKIGMLLAIILALLFTTAGCSAEEAVATHTSTATKALSDTTEAPDINKFEYGADENDIIDAIREAELINPNPSEYVNPILRLDGDKYDYEVSGVTITCDINIDDYIQHDGDISLIDLRQLAIDAGWQFEECEEDPPYAISYIMPNGSDIYITLEKTSFPEAQSIEYRAETISYSIRDVHNDILILPNHPITTLQKLSSLNSEYLIIGKNQNCCAISMDEIIVLTYMLSVGKIEVDRFDLVHVLGNSDLNSTGTSFIIP